MTVGYFEDNPEYARYVSSLLRGWAAERGRDLDIRHFENGLIPVDLDLSDYYFDCAHLFSPGDKASQGAGRACQGVFLQGGWSPSNRRPPFCRD